MGHNHKTPIPAPTCRHPMIKGGPTWPARAAQEVCSRIIPHKDAPPLPWGEVLARADAVTPVRAARPPRGWTHVYRAVWDREAHLFVLRLPKVVPGQRVRIVADSPPPVMMPSLGLSGAITAPPAAIGSGLRDPYVWFRVDPGQDARLSWFAVRVDMLELL